jgi:uncharacterized protein (TIGR02231 family)
MKDLMKWLLVLTIAAPAYSQTEKSVESKITQVTVFLSNAQVTREVKSRIEAGKTSLIVSGLTSQLDQQSIQVAGKGNYIITGIAHRQNYLSEHNMPKKLQVLKDSLELLQRQVQLEQSQKEILNKEEQMLLSNQKVGGANQNLTVAELKGMADFFRSRMTDIVTMRMKQDEKIKHLNETIVRLQQQIAEQNNVYSRNTSEIVISLSAEAASAVELTLDYVVPNAGWTPIYDLRAINTKSPVQLSYKANVFQNTGEEWKNVHLRLSTANPNLGGLKPELYPWYLDFLAPVRTPRYRYDGGAVGNAAPAAAEMKMEMDEDVAPAKTTAQYVSTIQTSLNTEFDISLPYTVTSAGKPTLVDIRNHELAATYRYATAPKLDGDAFLMARITGWEEYSLLPGEANVFFEGTFVANTMIDPQNIKDTLSVSLGRDKRVVVKREKVKDFTSRKAVGANQRDSYAWEISVRNTKSEPIRIIVEDQIPVSSNSQIEVTLVDQAGARYNKDSGKLTWEFELPPAVSKSVILKYEVRYPKDKVVSGLY